MFGSPLFNYLIERSKISKAPFSFDWEGARLIFFQTPDAFDSILLENQNHFVRSGGPPRLFRLLGNGLLRSQGETHQRQRKLTSHAFVPRAMDGYARTMRSLAEKHLTAWPRNKQFDLHAALTQLTLEMVAEVFFSLRGKEVSDLGWMLQTAIENLEIGKNRLAEIKRELLFITATHQLDRFLYGAIASGRDSDNLMGTLIRAKEQKGQGNSEEGMSRVELRDELVTLLVAGHETTATALAWSAYLIAQEPRLIAQIHEGGEAFAKAVFAESLRLFPPAWVLMRRAISDVEIVGCSVRKGEIAVLCPFTIGRDETLFPNASHTLPERWLTGQGYSAKGFIPFGLGKRRCLGESFAWSQGIEVLKSWTALPGFNLSVQRVARPAALFTLRPHGGLWASMKTCSS